MIQRDLLISFDSAPTVNDEPTVAPVAGPTDAPVAGPTDAPVAGPTDAPAPSPTIAPTAGPTAGPTAEPIPTVSPSSAPTAEFIEIRMGGFFMAFNSQNKVDEPTEEQYDDALEKLDDWFGGTVFAAEFESNPDLSFVSVEHVLNRTLYGENAGIPEEKYNIYMEFEDVILTFTRGSTNIPNANDLYIIYKNGMIEDYIYFVRELDGPIGGTIEAYSEREATLP